MPTKIVYGYDSIESLDDHLKKRKTLLITSRGSIERGLVKRIKSITPHIVDVVSDVSTHPELKDLQVLYEKIAELEFEVILAVGGGSVLDAAKFFSLQNEAKEYSFVEDLTKGKKVTEQYTQTPLISVPTTAGTGSEITPWATIWDMNEKKKYSLHLPELFSEVAIYDPNLTLSVPHQITIQTGLDTLSHALESIWNKNASPITVDYAIKSAKLIVNNLVALSHDLDNIELRDNIMKACMYAGLAFSNTQTAIAHGLSYYITAHKGVDHGIACSFTLPMLIDNVIGKYEFIDDAIYQIFGELSSKKLRVFFSDLGVSTQFEDYGMEQEDMDSLIESLKNSQRASNSLAVFRK